MTRKISVEASRNASRLLAALELLGEHGHERGLDRRVGEQAADQVGDLEGDRERRHRALDPEVAGGDDLAHQPGDPRERRSRSEKKAVERARRPARGCGATQPPSGPRPRPPPRRRRSERLVGAGRPRSVGSSGSSRPRYSPPSPDGQHRLTEEAHRPHRARATREPPPDRARSRRTSGASSGGRLRRRGAIAERAPPGSCSRIDKAVQKGALHANNGARKKARARAPLIRAGRRPARTARSRAHGARRRAPHRERQRDVVGVVGAAARPPLEVGDRAGGGAQLGGASAPQPSAPASSPRRGASWSCRLDLPSRASPPRAASSAACASRSRRAPGRRAA